MYISAEDTNNIGYTLYNLLLLKIIFDHGIDVTDIEYWTEPYTTGEYGTDMVEMVLKRVFEIKDTTSANASGDMQLTGIIPVLVELRQCETWNVNFDGRVTRFLNWFEDKFIALWKNDARVEFVPSGQVQVQYQPWEPDLFRVVDQMIRLKRVTEKYLEFTKRSEELCLIPKSA